MFRVDIKGIKTSLTWFRSFYYLCSPRTSKMKFFMKDFFSKYDHIRWQLLFSDGRKLINFYFVSLNVLIQRCIQNPVKHLRQNFLRKEFYKNHLSQTLEDIINNTILLPKTREQRIHNYV